MTPRSSTTVDDVLRLLLAGARLAAQPGVTGQELDRVVDRLLVRDPAVDSGGHAQEVLRELLPTLWEGGWQPADLAHAVRRKVSTRAARLVAAVIAGEAAAEGVAERAPRAWTAQLAELDSRADTVAGWWQAERVPPAAGWRDVLRVVGLLRTLPRLEQLVPPPSGWSAALLADSSWDDVVDARALSRIRGLLAKAESTDFEAEAEALTAKAQELMARHAIDTAMLGHRGAAPATTGQVQARRLHLDDPHAEAKAAVVQAVGTANGVRVVLLPAFGIATLVGMPGDLDAVELLVTSLLLQSGRALADAVQQAGSRGRTAAYRRGFFYSYAQRIEERLTEARDQARVEATATYGSALAPVLADQQAAVDRAVEELFPSVRRRSGRTVDAAGWHAGRQAADAADLGGTRLTGG
ncbi:DUF2786 domain-containing protein [Modestobacter versicolor]|uniref:DUF2786 domain-containing protein n=1 Tax=Modestobacter versicolor TaxID=429133 RepID=A0A839Y7C8_9ACTN|nr:DUF2786 domain-containing protein [Modestobacter versicolor]MBB3676174.1 hypothetical protein [Modestobacter versicolor]